MNYLGAQIRKLNKNKIVLINSCW